MLTTMKIAKALPLSLGSLYISARIPATTAMGELPVTPQNRRNTSNEGQFGEKPQAMVKRVKMVNVAIHRFRRPLCSLSGPQIRGPITYPMR